MTQEESLQSQQTLRTINEYLMNMYKQGKLKRRTMATKDIQLPDKYQTPDWIWENKTIDQLAEEYVECVKKCNDAPTWDLIHTAVCYGYGLNARKEEQNMKVYRSAYHKGDILRTDCGFEFVVSRVYRDSIFEQIYYSGYSPKDLGFIAGVKEEKCKKIGFDPNWEDYQRVRNK